MRRVLSALLALVMLFGFACAEICAYTLANGLAAAVEQVSDVQKAPLDELENRAIWEDSRANAKCALVIYENQAAAMDAVLADSTRDTAVRAVESCALYLDSDMGAEAIRAYERALAEILGAKLDTEEPDYILNVNTGKIHCPYCYSVLEMKETNKLEYTGEREDATVQGYVPCKRCNP